MARRRGTELETRFTGDDTDLRKAEKRSIAGAGKLGAAYDKAGKKAQTSIGKISAKIKGLGNMKIGGLAALAGGGALGALVGKRLSEKAQFAEEADKLLKASEKVGIDVVDFQRQADAARKAGIENDQYFNSISKLTRQIELAKNENDGLRKNFENLGINVDELSGKAANVQFREVATGFASQADRDKAFADLAKIIEDDAKQFRAFFGQGGAAIAAQEAAVDPESLFSLKSAKEAAGFLDREDTQRSINRANAVRDLSANNAVQKVKKNAEEFRDAAGIVMSGARFGAQKRKARESGDALDKHFREMLIKADLTNKQLQELLDNL